MFVRESCPVCNSKEAINLIQMTKEYLWLAESGWKQNTRLMGPAGFDYDKNPDFLCSYYECCECGLFYLREIMEMDKAVDQLAKENTEKREKGFKQIGNNKIKSYVENVDASIKMISLSLKTQKDDYSVLDYGCGGGVHLSILKSFRIKNVVGYDISDKHFDLIHKYMHNDIKLTTSREELLRYAPFDAIRCNTVLEHVFEPNEIVTHIYSLLKKGGIVFFNAPCVSRKEMERYKKKVDKNIRVKLLHTRHCQIWNKNRNSLSRYIQSHGFKIIPYCSYKRSYDVTNTSELFEYISYLLYKGAKAGIDAFSTKINRHKFQVFFGEKL